MEAFTGKDERRGYANIGSLIYTPKPSKDGSVTKVEISASVRSSKISRRQEEEDVPPDWVEQVDLLKSFEGEGHDDDELSCNAVQSNIEEEEVVAVSCGLQRNNEEMDMSVEHENVEGSDGVQQKQGLNFVEEGCEHKLQELGQEIANMKMSREEMENMMSRKERENMMLRKEIENMKMSRKERENMMLRKEMEDIEMSRRQYFAALIAAKEKPGEETLALAAGLRLKLEAFLAIPSFSSFDHLAI